MFGSFSKLQTHKSSESSTGMFVRPIHLIAPLPGARLSCFPYLQSSVPDPRGWILQAEQAQCSERGPGSTQQLCQSAPQPQGCFPSVLSVSHVSFWLAFHPRHLSPTSYLAGFLHITAVLKQGWITDHL